MLRKLHLLLIFFLSFTITACANTRIQAIPSPDPSAYVVAPVLRELYDYLGGKNILGEAISPAKEVDGVISQYTVAGLMIFDPHAPASRKFQFGALGKDFGILSPPNASELEIAPPFREFYERLRGAAFVGLPLSGQVYNDEKERTEQYFENLGFYQGLETDGAVGLLPYGAWGCGDECLGSLPMNAAPLMASPTHTSSTPQAPTLTPQTPQVASPTAHKWLVRVWEGKLMVSITQDQEIVLSIQRDGLPLEGARASLAVSLPDDTTRNADFSPTDADGMARLKVAPIQAKNGTMIPYQVCIESDSGDQYCVQQSYVIWTTP
jgi:hypothetical protein